jgi:hypothetical protein
MVLHTITTFIATLHAFPLLLGLRSAAVILHDWSFEERDYSYKGKNYPFAVLILVMFLFTNLLRVALWVII